MGNKDTVDADAGAEVVSSTLVATLRKQYPTIERKNRVKKTKIGVSNVSIQMQI